MATMPTRVLADDPIHKLLLDRDPLAERAPGFAYPTISRFENGAGRAAALPDGARVGGVRHRASSASPRQGRASSACHHRSGPDKIDLDARGPAAHVLQRALLAAGVICRCMGFLSFDREAEQYLCAAVLRPGKAVAADGTLGLLCRLLPLLTSQDVSADAVSRSGSTGAYATPEVFGLSWMRSPGSTTW